MEEPEPRTCVTIDEWIDVWGTIVGKAKNMDDLPMWLQYYPRTLFDVINRTGIFMTFKLNMKRLVFSQKNTTSCLDLKISVFRYRNDNKK